MTRLITPPVVTRLHQRNEDNDLIITNITHEVPFLWKPPADRPAGIHLSDILKRMREELLNQIYPDDCDLEPDELASARAKRERGFMYEDMCQIAYAENIMPRPEPFLYDGVWVSPDGAGIENDSGRIRVDEIKSYDGFDIHKCTQWFWQHKIYCLAMGTNYGRFYVYHNFGIEKRGLRPLPQVYQVDYGWPELIENKQQIWNFAKSKGLV